MAKGKKKEEIAVTISTSRTLTFDLGIPYWDQLVKVAKEIVDRDAEGYTPGGNGIPDTAEVTFQGWCICVDWDDD